MDSHSWEARPHAESGSGEPSALLPPASSWNAPAEHVPCSRTGVPLVPCSAHALQYEPLHCTSHQSSTCASTDFNCDASLYGGQLERTSEGAALWWALTQADGGIHALAARLRLQIAPQEVKCAEAAVCMYGCGRGCVHGHGRGYDCVSGRARGYALCVYLAVSWLCLWTWLYLWLYLCCDFLL